MGKYFQKISSITGFAYPKLIYDNSRTKVEFYGSILKQNDVAFYGPIVNIYIVYRLSSKTNKYSTVLENCLFGAMNITKNTHVDKYEYSGYGIGFDSKGSYTHPDRGYGKNVTIFGSDLSNSKHANNKTKNVLVLGQDFIQKINDTTINAEKMYSHNFTVENKTFCLGIRYNGDDSYLFVNGKELLNLKPKPKIL